jgi:DNA-binding NarL/FixJ family response regulator
MRAHTIRTKSWRQPLTQAAGFALAAISDDETLARRAATILEREGMIVTVEASGPDISVIEDLERQPDLVLLRRAANRPGLEHALLSTRHRLATARRIVVLPRPDAVNLGALLSAGAEGVVLEKGLELTLGAVVQAIATGHICVPAELRVEIEPPSLSHRERQILALSVAGLTNAQIADRLYVAESTVKTHLSAAFRRLGVHSRREAASLVLRSDGVLRRMVLGTLGLSETATPREES